VIALRRPDRVNGGGHTFDTAECHCLDGCVGILEVALLITLPHNGSRSGRRDRDNDARGQNPSVVDSITQSATPSDEPRLVVTALCRRVANTAALDAGRNSLNFRGDLAISEERPSGGRES
jgi:hypothetical protein